VRPAKQVFIGVSVKGWLIGRQSTMGWPHDLPIVSSTEPKDNARRKE